MLGTGLPEAFLRKIGLGISEVKAAIAIASLFSRRSQKNTLRTQLNNFRKEVSETY